MQSARDLWEAEQGLRVRPRFMSRCHIAIAKVGDALQHGKKARFFELTAAFGRRACGALYLRSAPFVQFDRGRVAFGAAAATRRSGGQAAYASLAFEHAEHVAQGVRIGVEGDGHVAECGAAMFADVLFQAVDDHRGLTSFAVWPAPPDIPAARSNEG